jgi:hypothetical protein
MSIFSKLFQRYPRYEVSGYRTIYNALVTRLSRSGVTVGKTSKIPRVEIHSIREGERLDKEGAIRQITLTVESMSNKSLGDAVTMNEDNLKLLTEYELELDGWTCMGIIPGQLQDLVESKDTEKIVYRLLQEMVIFLEKVKTDTPPTPAEPANEQGNN